MNDYQVNLYNNLMNLVNDSEAFYFSDQQLDDSIFRIFNYRLASYTEFLRPGALECRGTMFEVDENGKPIRLASIAFEKFFNLFECPFTMDLDLSQVEEIADKADGSLITPYNHRDDLRLKSKGSLESDQAIDSMGYLYLPENEAFRLEVEGAERLECSVQLEWCAPHNRIVIGYEEPELRVLGVRSRVDGSYLHFKDVDIYVFPEITKRWTKLIPFTDAEEYINEVDSMIGVEGVVCRMADGQRFKKKGQWYLALHHTKDSINSPRRLFEAVLEEATDDMRSLFHDDAMAIKLIEDMETFVEEKYNHLADQTDKFYKRNNHMERKDYAILGQKELNRLQFGCAMQLYTGKIPNYNQVLKKAWKSFGLRDVDTPIQDV